MLGIGALSALIFFNRPPDIVFLLPVLYYIAKEKYWQPIPAVVIAGLPFLAYNMYYFGSIFGGYNFLLNPDSFTLTSGSQTSGSYYFAFSSMFGSIPGRFIDNGLVLLVYTPLMILAFIGIVNVVKHNKVKDIYKDVHLTLIISLVLFCIIFGIFNNTDGWGYGPRYWTDALPVLIIFIGWSKAEGRLYNTAFTCLALISFIIQAYGAYVYLLRPY
jgi:hypothetical protein